MTIATPLSTSGRFIVDARGKRVRLAGVNWYGASEDLGVPAGRNSTNRSICSAWSNSAVRTGRAGDRIGPVNDPIPGLAERMRAICLALPEVTERLSHGAPTWFVRGKSSFVTLWADGHHDDQFPHLWCAAPPGAQRELTAAAPDRFFRPPYVGGRGWIGVRLDRDPDWTEIAELCQDAYRAVAPARLAKQLDG
ncbi:MAG TPA: MmcQ/YjbR family DNA-binding protein [Streptosporangiaceae bacterium]|nr:MmcQ/YjbR family DNA-binding protein [Streptosporangiaceae bacterium]